DLRLHLVEAAEHVGVVLRELAHAEQTRERARALVAMQPPDVGEAQRKVAIGTQRVPIDQRRLRAVHRLEAKQLLLGLYEEHVLAVIIPVPRLLPQLLVDEDRRGDLLIPRGVEILAHEALELAHDRPAARQPDRRPRRDLVEDEEVELAPELAVVALLGLLQTPEMAVEL